MLCESTIQFLLQKRKEKKHVIVMVMLYNGFPTATKVGSMLRGHLHPYLGINIVVIM